MSWHLGSSPAQVFHAQLYGLFKSYDAVSLITSEGAPIHVKWRNPADIATLPSAADTVHKYMKLNDSEVVVVNDPYSGGSQLSDLSFVVGVAKTKGPAELLLTVRLQCAPRIGENSVEQEGVRIPPTPLGTLTQLNTALIGAISQHPLAPSGIASQIEELIPRLVSTHAQLQELLKHPRSPFGKSALQNYFEQCSSAAHRRMGQLPLGDHTLTRKLSSGATLKLRISVHDQMIEFDFTGSDSAGDVQLTEQISLGACVAATMRATGMNWPINAGVLSAFAVRTPARTCVNAAYPSPTRKGISEGVYVIAQTVHDHLVRNSNAKSGASAGPSLAVELNFANGAHFFDQLAHGRPATDSRAGEHSLNFWNRAEFALSSPEAVERSFPVKVLRWGLRLGSEGKGKFAGGLGSERSIQLTADAELKWDLNSVAQAKGSDNGSDGVAAQLEVTARGEKPKTFSGAGSVKLKAGSIITWSSAGGGGFGAAPEVD